MKFEAKVTPHGAFIQAYLICDEFSSLNYKHFLLDTGSAISVLSVKDLGENDDYSHFNKKKEITFGVGSFMECYLIHNAKLFLSSTTNELIEI